MYFEIFFYMFLRQPLKGEVSCLIILGLQLEYKVIVVIIGGLSGIYWQLAYNLGIWVTLHSVPVGHKRAKKKFRASSLDFPI